MTYNVFGGTLNEPYSTTTTLHFMFLNGFTRDVRLLRRVRSFTDPELLVNGKRTV